MGAIVMSVLKRLIFSNRLDETDKTTTQNNIIKQKNEKKIDELENTNENIIINNSVNIALIIWL